MFNNETTTERMVRYGENSVRQKMESAIAAMFEMRRERATEGGSGVCQSPADMVVDGGRVWMERKQGLADGSGGGWNSETLSDRYH